MGLAVLMSSSLDLIAQAPIQVTVPGSANIFGAGHAVPPAPGGGGAGVLPTMVPLDSYYDHVTFDAAGLVSCCGDFAKVVGVDTALDVIFLDRALFAQPQQVRFGVSCGTLPGGLTTGVPLYVRGSGTAIQVAPALTGPVVDITSSGSGRIFMSTYGENNGPDGGPWVTGSTNITGYGGISGIRHDSRVMFLVGVFVGDLEPADPQPPAFDFTTGEGYTDLFPQLRQLFFIGDGFTGLCGGSRQRVWVPQCATRLYLGFADALNFGNPISPPGFYGDNYGDLQVTVQPTFAASRSQLVPPQGVVMALQGMAQPPRIGEVRISTTLNQLDARFVLDPAWRHLDQCYEFQWVSLVRNELRHGIPQSRECGGQRAVPFIDSHHPWPFYWSPADWTAWQGFSLCVGSNVQVRKEGDFTYFTDCPATPSCPGNVLAFETHLFARPVGQGVLGQALVSFEWTSYSDSTDSRFCGFALPGSGRLNLALANSGFSSWTSAAGPAPSCVGLTGTPATLSAVNGGTWSGSYDSRANGGSDRSGLLYFVLGSTSGTIPGVDLGRLLATVPFNFDAYSQLLVTAPFPPLFQQFVGFVSAQGTALPSLVLPPGWGFLAGTTFDHVVLTFEPTGAVHCSNPVRLVVNP